MKEQPRVPKDWPIVPLGMGPKGTDIVLLDSIGRLVSVPGEKLSRAMLETLCAGAPDWLAKTFPKTNSDTRKPIPRSIDYTIAGNAIRRVAAAQGFADPGSVRGRGAWPGEDGDLILHQGDRLLISQLKGRRPFFAEIGQRGDYYYPAGLPLPEPISIVAVRDAALRLFRALSLWEFARGDLDRLLMLGWTGQAYIAGARRSRSNVIVWGETQVGKTLLHTLLRAVLGHWCVYSNDATAAGVRQRLNGDTLAVLLDEVERGRAGGRFGATRRQLENAELVRLLRVSFDGGLLLRGNANHQHHEAALLAPMLISAITPPLLEAQDRSRVPRLHLTDPPVGAPDARLLALAPEIGRHLAGRIVGYWGRLHEIDEPAWRQALEAAGLRGRLVETLGNLLACASVLLAETDELDSFISRYDGGLDALREEVHRERAPRWKDVLFELRSLPVPGDRPGELAMLGDLWREAAGWRRHDLPDADALGIPRGTQNETAARHNAEHDQKAQEARRRLCWLGFDIASGAPVDCNDRVLLIADRAPALLRLLKESPLAEWAEGGVADMLAGAPSARQWPAQVKFAFGATYALAIPLDLALAGMVGEDPVGTAEAWDEAAR